MKSIKTICCAMLAAGMLMTGCSSMTNTGKGALIGGGGGGALGAGIGALIGGGKGAGIGAAIGSAVGAGAGALIGRKMDKQAEELKKQLAEADVETVTDQNGLQAIKVTFPGGILFPTNGTSLSANAKTELSQFATSLMQNPDTDVQIYGFTDNTGSMEVNTRVSNGRAESVLSYLVNSGVAPTRVRAQGVPMADYVASNATAEGRAQNRRVEIYITADKQMIEKANAGTLQ
ncbi:MAG: OmpA family protein [Muribaculaceae bacterium]|nr:OmpA family protein [Muribaculaceae bacterium]MDE6629682.1 OmpA family protein [Muribaculaceae bacterium]